MANVTENTTEIAFNASTTYDPALAEYIRILLIATAILVPIIFGIVFVVGLIGNLLLIYTVARNRSMRTNPNIFLVSLSVGDCLLLVISAPFTSIYYTVPEWYFGVAMCKINEFMQTLSLGVSIFTLTAVSGDRFVAVVFPMLSHRWSTMRRTVEICAGLWVASVALAVPDLVSAYVGPYDDTDRLFIVCKLYPQEWGVWYTRYRVIMRFSVYFLLPMLVISFMYIMIARTLLRKPVETLPPGGAGGTAAWTKQIRARKKISKVVLCIVVLFAVCWIPRHVYTLVYHFVNPHYNTAVHVFKILGFCLSFVYSCVNPVALYVVSDDFRQYFDHYLFGCCCPSRRMKARRETVTTGVAHSMGP